MSRIGLIDVDGHAKKKKFGATIYPNLALCKISAWHKAQGDEVVWYEPMYTGHCDKVYVSKIFNFTPDVDFCIDADEIIRGGTGYDVHSSLPVEVDMMQPDYDIYPLLPKDVAYGFLTRGCPNKCKWCVVPRKEGAIRPYMDIDQIATLTRTKIILMDNNILAAGDYAKEQLQKIIDRGYKVDFNQALDARLVTDEFAKLLAQIRECERAMEMINSHGYKGQYFLYTMLNDNFDECWHRISYWWNRNQELVTKHQTPRVYPYAQPYRDPYNPSRPIPQWQKDLAGWVNKKMLFEKIHFWEFEPRKGFRCIKYFR